ncbi:Protein TSSC1 [Blattella germanica]|nr:Protein TSSC1 [Blattella germanica]
MEDDTPVIYGLEFQVHLVELNEETGGLTTHVYQHGAGEVWHLASSPSDASVIATSYNTLTDQNTCCMKSAIWKLPSFDDSCNDDTQDHQEVNELEALELICQLDTESYGQDVKITCFHPTEGSKAATVVDNKFLIWDLNNGRSAKEIHSGVLEGKGQPRFTTGKWNPHHGCSQDLDFNPNKQYFMATCGDDGYSRFWDVRNPSEPAIARADHSHWVWSIRYNHFHDQLILTSSSDSQVILTSVASISSEPLSHMVDDDSNQDDAVPDTPKEKLEDGVLATYDEHEDSVYSVEWSSADPWTFASLSYDGRLVISKVPRADKYMILL